MRSSRTLDSIAVTFDDARSVDHAGLLLPASLGARLGLADLFEERVSVSTLRHGAHLADKALTIVHGLMAGADCIDDLDVLRAGSSAAVLGHRACAPSTVGSFLRGLTLGHVRQLDAVAGELLVRAWAGGRGGGRQVIDIDSTLCETFGLRKDGAREVMRTGRRGYHPLVAATGDGEVVHARLRRGRTNDGSGAGRFTGETLARLARAGATEVVVRADSGFYQADVVAACRRRDVRFSIGARMHKGLARTIAGIPEDAWVPIDYPFGEGAAVAEISWHAFAVDHRGHDVPGVHARCIVRRVPPSPAIQAPLFPVFSYHPFITDQDGDLVELDRFHRDHARIENVIKDLKYNAGLNHFPSGRFGANSAWLVLATLAHNLSRWVGRFGFDDGTRTLKTMRRRALAVPGHITTSARRRTLHLPDRWPWATHFLDALNRIRSIPLMT
jgi:hypothetical protein